MKSNITPTFITCSSIPILDAVQQVSEELVTSLEDTQCYQWTGDIMADVFSQALNPIHREVKSTVQEKKFFKEQESFNKFFLLKYF